MVAFAGLQIGMNVLGGPAVPDSIDASASGSASGWMSVYQVCGSIAGLAVAAALRGVAGAALAGRASDRFDKRLVVSIAGRGVGRVLHRGLGDCVRRSAARRAGLGARVALVAVIVKFALGTAWLWRLNPDRLRS